MTDVSVHSWGEDVTRPCRKSPNKTATSLCHILAVLLGTGLCLSLLSGCTPDGRAATKDDLRAILDQVLTTGYTIGAQTQESSRQGEWSITTDDGLEFTCLSDIVAIDAVASEWRTSCYVADAWVAAHRDTFIAAWTPWATLYPSNPSSPNPTESEWATTNVTVAQWNDIGPLARTLAITLNNNPVPLVTEPHPTDLQIDFPVPCVTWHIGDTEDEASDSQGNGCVTFATIDSLVSVERTVNDIRASYVDALTQGTIYDDTVPAEATPPDYSGPTYVWRPGQLSGEILTMNLTWAGSSAEVSAETEPLCEHTPQGDELNSWPTWTRVFSGTTTTVSFNSIAGTCSASWIINGHIWELTEPDMSPGGRASQSTWPMVTETEPSPTMPHATKDGTPLSISPRLVAGATRRPARWAYSLQDLEQLLDVTITMNPTNPVLALLVQNP